MPHLTPVGFRSTRFCDLRYAEFALIVSVTQGFLSAESGLASVREGFSAPFPAGRYLQGLLHQRSEIHPPILLGHFEFNPWAVGQPSTGPQAVSALSPSRPLWPFLLLFPTQTFPRTHNRQTRPFGLMMRLEIVLGPIVLRTDPFENDIDSRS